MDNMASICRMAERFRDQSEDVTRISPEVRDAVGEAGLWSICVPKTAGGLELPMPEQLALTEQLGEADASVAWLVCNSVGVGWASSWLPDTDRRTVLNSRLRPFGLGAGANATLRTQNQTYVLEGSWPLMTGAADSEWCLLSGRIVDESGENLPGPPQIGRAIVPVDQIEIEETWTTASAMRGTGSHAVHATNVAVPMAHVIDPTKPPLADNPIARWSLPAIVWGHSAAIAIGALRSAINGAAEIGGQKISRIDGHPHYDEPRVQEAITDATAAADSLSAGLNSSAQQLWLSIANGETPEESLRARWWSIVFYTFELTAEHASRLYRISTSAVFTTRNPVQRALGDIHAIATAFENLQSLRHDAGRVLLGHKATHPLM